MYPKAMNDTKGHLLGDLFVFNFAISVNETLQTLQKEGKAEHVGKSPNNAGLWIKGSTAFAEFARTQEVKGQEPTEVGS